MLAHRALVALAFACGITVIPSSAFADIILNGTTQTLGGIQNHNIISLTNGARIIVTPFNGVDRVNTGNLVLKANTITIDATSMITAKGAGYPAGLCRNGAGPSLFPLSGGRGGCGVRDSGGGGAHFGIGGRGTKDGPTSYPAGFEEDCVGAVVAANNACVNVTDCRNNDGLPTVAGLPFFHSIYDVEFGAAGGDKGCRDGDGFPGPINAGNGGGRIVLFAANPAQTGSITINGVVTTNGRRGCASGNDSAGGGAGGSILIAGDNVTIGSTAKILAAGGRGGDSQPKCLPCTTNADCGGTGQTCVAGRCSPCNCTPCTNNSQCNALLGQTCKPLGGAFGNVCANAANQCTPFESFDNEAECVGAQNSGLCDDCAGGGGGGIINVLSRVSSINPAAKFDVSGALGGICPICEGEAGGGAGELQIDGAYVGEICDGYDNDFNGTVDDGLPMLNCNGTMTPSCVNGIPQECPANVPACIQSVSDTRSRFVVVLDTSGSMLNDIGGKPTFGDGSTTHPGADTSTDADTLDGNNSRLFIAKRALNNVFAAFPHADYALARYHQDVSLNRSCQTANWFECQKLCCSYDDPRDNVAPLYSANPLGCNPQSIYSAGYPSALNAQINVGWQNLTDCINYAGSCGPPRRGADVLVGFEKPLQQHLMWLDGRETNFNSSIIPGDNCNFPGGGDCELRGTGPTPLAGSLQAVEDYLKPIIACDGAVPCRKYSVILLTDGAESCQGNPVAAATSLRNAVPGTQINTYVIGFSTLPGETSQLNAVANAGGTNSAIFASDENTLSNALAAIIASSTVFEKCNSLDDDCDSLIDEDFPDKGQVCDDGLKGICKGTGVRVCNATQDGTTCQITNPGQSPKAEVCNGLDDNCNGLIDENGICQVCVPTVETCNNLDDDCDGQIDNNPVGVGQPCGLNVGLCQFGTTTCTAGALQCIGGVGPATEECNGLDDDCNGVIDGMNVPCYPGPAATLDVGVCKAGTQACVAMAGSGIPAFGPCVGAVVPSIELCDGFDNDCNGQVDDNVPDGFGNVTGDPCCRFAGKCGVGVCTSGVYKCAGSQVVCDGGVDPSAELCDELDNDCNGTVDDVVGVGLPCVLGSCPGVLQCENGVGLVCVAASTSLEVCNGIDDDCDGSIDEEPEVSQNDPKIGVPCDEPQPPLDNPPCAPGVTTCKLGGVACDGAVKSSKEVCDAIDNDCDGITDQPDPCPAALDCINGKCLSKCLGKEFPCPGGETCIDGYCVPQTDAGAPTGSGGAGGNAGAGGMGGNAGAGGMGGDAGGAVSSSSSSSSSSGVASSSSSSGGSENTSSGGGQGDDNVYGLATGGGGCACTIPSESPRNVHSGILAAMAGLFGLMRRQRMNAKQNRGAR